MNKKDGPLETGTIIARRVGVCGPVITAAITLPEHVWVRLTAPTFELWQDAQDDLELRELTFDELIALFVSNESDRWCDRMDADDYGDPSDKVPF